MKKSDLKTGMRVRMRNNQIYLVIKDIQHVDSHEEFAVISGTGFIKGSNYNDELINVFGYSNNYDIMEVYTINEKLNSLLNAYTLDLDKKFSIWKRQEYTDEQKEIFKALKVLGLNWIARDKDNDIYAYYTEPRKNGWNDAWGLDCEEGYLKSNNNKEVFGFIKWEDEKPFKIPTL